MRLTRHQIETIRKSATELFGRNTRVWLFGSRVNDMARGGDIDLYIEPQSSEMDELVNAKLHFLMALHQALGYQKIDVVIRPANTTEELPIYGIAKKTGILLS
ncbi:MAG: hypothetical protein QG652_534 [Pseudomonadota bacterium]|nr:hypothetical protein [Pseudomonadota bacterium]